MRRARSAGLAAAIILMLVAGYAEAQDEVPRRTTAFTLPRPGYEPRRLRFGQTIVAPQLRIQEIYDSNVFASAANVEDDFVTVIEPRVEVQTSAGKLDLDSTLFMTVNEHLQHEQENTTEYGGEAALQYEISRAHEVAFTGAYARQFESRSDPEADRGRDEPPAELNAFRTELSYNYDRNRLGAELAAGLQRIDFLDSAEEGRDRWVYRGSMRGSYLLTPRYRAFVELYARRRDHDRESDRVGRDRDAATYGTLAGLTIDITGKLFGEIGAGIFYTEFDDPAFTGLAGFGARSRLVWNMAPRTTFIATVSRQDEATAEPGASSRVDARASLRLEQEARRNLLLGAELGVLESTFEDTGRNQLSVSSSVSGEYLLNRHVSLVARLGYTERSADIPDNEYQRLFIGLGARLRF